MNRELPEGEPTVRVVVVGDGNGPPAYVVNSDTLVHLDSKVGQLGYGWLIKPTADVPGLYVLYPSWDTPPGTLLWEGHELPPQAKIELYQDIGNLESDKAALARLLYRINQRLDALYKRT